MNDPEPRLPPEPWEVERWKRIEEAARVHVETVAGNDWPPSLAALREALESDRTTDG